MRERIKKTVSGGLYLVVDPAIELDILLEKLQSALTGGIDVIQIWNNWPEESNKLLLIEEIARLCSPYSIPILINEDWTLLLETASIDGIHFDHLPDDLDSIRDSIGRPFIIGVTCKGSSDLVQLAGKKELDYISFCSMFPSNSAGNCTIVMPETVERASKITDIPIFISGGMTPENTAFLRSRMPFDGVAVISGILSAKDPGLESKAYQHALNTKNDLL